MDQRYHDRGETHASRVRPVPQFPKNDTGKSTPARRGVQMLATLIVGLAFACGAPLGFAAGPTETGVTLIQVLRGFPWLELASLRDATIR